MNGRPFTSVDDQIIKQMFGNSFMREIAVKLNRGISSVYGRCYRLGLKLSAERRNKVFKDNLDKGRLITNTRFKKGHKTWNKGMKGLHLSPGSEFKKGHLPNNTLFDGAITIRRDKNGMYYKYIRMAQAKWELYHRYLWVEAYGEIPADKIVAFKDSNSMNCVPENLELITRAENMYRNSYLRYPEDLRRVVQLKGALNRQINKHNKAI